MFDFVLGCRLARVWAGLLGRRRRRRRRRRRGSQLRAPYYRLSKQHNCQKLLEKHACF
jgi:hypothetical protein